MREKEGEEKSPSPIDAVWGEPPSAQDLRASLEERDELWNTLIEAALGIAPSDDGFAAVAAGFWGVLHAMKLSKEEQQLLALSHGAVDTRSPIDQLVELRIRRALAAAHDCCVGKKQVLPHIVLARGEEPFLHEGTLVRLSSGVAVTVGEGELAKMPGGTIVQLSPEKRREISNTIVEGGADEEGGTIDELNETYVGQGLASSVGRESVQQAISHLAKSKRLPSLILTDQKGVDTMGPTVDLVTADSLRVSREAGESHGLSADSDAESGRAGVSGGSGRSEGSGRTDESGRMGDSTGNTLRALSMGQPLDRLEQVLLWSVESVEREELLKRSLRGNLRGAVLGNKYEIEQQMGRGGFGTVYRARDRILDVKVAIKVLNPKIAKKKDALARFLAEAQRLTAADHPNIVRWITFDRTKDGLHYFVMEYLEGIELAKLLELEGALDPMRAGEILLQVLAALRSVHTLPGGSELLHLDLKPQNVFMTKGTELDGERAKVIDFGISRYSQDKRAARASVSGDTPLTPTDSTHTKGVEASKASRASSSGASKSGLPLSGGSTIRRVLGGTVPYSSPEQCMHIIGEAEIRELDGRTDIYSLGVMAFEMLTGEMPFAKPKSVREAAINHIAIAPKKVLDVNRNVPRRLAEFVDKCLKKDPDERWSSADEAYLALDAIVHPRSKWMAVGLVAAILVAAGALAFVVARPDRVEASEKKVMAVRLLSGTDQDPKVYKGQPNTVELRAGTDVLLDVADLSQRTNLDPPGEIKVISDDLAAPDEETGQSIGVQADWDEAFQMFRLHLISDAVPSESISLGTGRLVWEQGEDRFTTPVLTFSSVPPLDLPPGKITFAVRTESHDEIVGPWTGDESPAKDLFLVDASAVDVVVNLMDPNRLVERAKLKLKSQGGFAPQELTPRASYPESEDRIEFSFRLSAQQIAELKGDVNLGLEIVDRLGAVLSLEKVTALHFVEQGLNRADPEGEQVTVLGPGLHSAQVVATEANVLQVCLPETWIDDLGQVELAIDLSGSLNAVARNLELNPGIGSRSSVDQWTWDKSERRVQIPSAEFAPDGILRKMEFSIPFSIQDTDVGSNDPGTIQFESRPRLLFVEFPTCKSTLVQQQGAIEGSSQVLGLAEGCFALKDHVYSLVVAAQDRTEQSQCSWWVRLSYSAGSGEQVSQAVSFDAIERHAEFTDLRWSDIGATVLGLEFFHAPKQAVAADLEGRFPFRTQELEITVLDDLPLMLSASLDLEASQDDDPLELFEQTLRRVMAESGTNIADRVYWDSEDGAPLQSISAALRAESANGKGPALVTWQSRPLSVSGTKRYKLCMPLGYDDLESLEDGTYLLTIEAKDCVGRKPKEERRLDWNFRNPEIVRVSGPGRIPSDGDLWRPKGGDYNLIVDVSDGNGLSAVTASVVMENGKRERDLPKWTMPQAADAPIKRKSQSWTVEFEEQDSFKTGLVIVTARDTDGKSNTLRIPFRLEDVDPDYAPRLSGLPGKDSEAEMLLVESPSDESYEMAQFNLRGDEGSTKKKELMRALAATGVFYAEPNIFAQYENYQGLYAMPARTVIAKDMPEPFYLDAHEVSIGQFRQFMEDPDGFRSEDFWRQRVGADYPERQTRFEQLVEWLAGKQDDLPMEEVSVEDAWGYAVWAGKRLPTYLEWELAMRGPSGTRLFALQDSGIAPEDRMRVVEYLSRDGEELIRQRATVYAEVGDQGAVPVANGGLGPNAEGFWNLGGNVSEWTCSPLLGANAGSAEWWIRESSGPFLIEPSHRSSRNRWWVVGASYGRLSTRLGTQIHDFRRSTHLGNSVLKQPNSYAIGFRCAISAKEAKRRITR